MAPSEESRRPAGVPAVATLSAALTLRASAAAVYDFLVLLPNHALISGHGLRLDGVADDGRSALISLHGPLGLRRTAFTTVTSLHRPDRFGGRAMVGRRTMAYVHWTIEPAGTGSRVTLSATIVRAAPVDRLLLAIGGRWWVRRSFARAIALLGAALEGAGGEPCARAAG
jgi:hypothetical protein